MRTLVLKTKIKQEILQNYYNYYNYITFSKNTCNLQKLYI